jgi:predicted double-glycine peptidase
MMQLVLIVLIKRIEMIRYYESFGYGGTTLSNIITNDLTHVSVSAENG